MEKIRTKDKLFLAVAGPVVLAVAYAYFWRGDTSRRVDALAAERAALVAVEDFPIERQLAERQLAEAREELAAEKKIPMPAVRVKADAADSVAARELAVLGIFRAAGLALLNSAAAEANDPRGGEVLKATGARPAPVCRTYEVGGGYPGLLAALREMAAREMAVVPACVGMSKSGHWTLSIWL